MNDRSGPTFAADVITSTVSDAIQDIPGVEGLHRSPLQTLGERVGRHGPVRLSDEEDGPALEVHIVASAGAHLPTVSEAVARAGATYLERTTGTPITHVDVFVDDIAQK